MSKEEKLKIEEEFLFNKTKAQTINLYIEKLEEIEKLQKENEELKDLKIRKDVVIDYIEKKEKDDDNWIGYELLIEPIRIKNILGGD